MKDKRSLPVVRLWMILNVHVSKYSFAKAKNELNWTKQNMKALDSKYSHISNMCCCRCTISDCSYPLLVQCRIAIFRLELWTGQKSPTSNISNISSTCYFSTSWPGQFGHKCDNLFNVYYWIRILSMKTDSMNELWKRCHIYGQPVGKPLEIEQFSIQFSNKQTINGHFRSLCSRFYL